MSRDPIVRRIVDLVEDDAVTADGRFIASQSRFSPIVIDEYVWLRDPETPQLEMHKGQVTGIDGNKLLVTVDYNP